MQKVPPHVVASFGVALTEDSGVGFYGVFADRIISGYYCFDRPVSNLLGVPVTGL